MSGKAKQAIKTLETNAKKYSARVEKKLSKSGTKPDPALVYSIAQYYPALKKLASK